MIRDNRKSAAQWSGTTISFWQVLRSFPEPSRDFQLEDELLTQGPLSFGKRIRKITVYDNDI